MVLETLRLLRAWLATHGDAGAHINADMLASMIMILTYYEAEFTLLQARVAGRAVPIEPSGNVVRFPLTGRSDQ